ncbi:hypothetical protein WR25_05590 [Diploscapter pachys]|uniref:Major facilitator superfamily (MFS) profile domain-containing protein n=1 Tax=Diploscapter pachys TaxID=2018661 RepID=A0A2A2LT96_9BILA|nr:hypothetical protein WR25_05590 [Diploscapter pachys]
MLVASIHYGDFSTSEQTISEYISNEVHLISHNSAIITSCRFAWLQVFAVAPTIFFLLLLLLTPTTPPQLLKQRCHTIDIVESLQYYYGSQYCIDNLRAEWSQTANNNKSESSKKIPFSTWKGFAIGCAAAASYAFTGDDLIDTFSSQMLTGIQGVSGVSTGMADLISVVMGVVLVLGSLGGAFLIDRFGRRRLIILGLLGCSISNLLLVIFPSSVRVATISFTLTKAFIGLGAGAPAWFLTTELVPPSRVSLFQSFSTGILLITTMLVTFFYLRLELAIHQYSILLLTTGPAMILAILLFLFLPETQNRNNAEIQHLLNTPFSGFAKPKKSRLISISSSYGSMNHCSKSATRTMSSTTFIRVRRKRQIDPQSAVVIESKRRKGESHVISLFKTGADLSDLQLHSNASFIDFVPENAVEQASIPQENVPTSQANPLDFAVEGVGEIGEKCVRPTPSKEIITINGRPLVPLSSLSRSLSEKGEDYVFDLYQVDEKINQKLAEEEKEWQMRFANQDELQFGDANGHDGDSDGSSNVMDDDEDSNAEDNWRNDYPDGESQHSEDNEYGYSYEYEANEDSYDDGESDDELRHQMKQFGV